MKNMIKLLLIKLNLLDLAKKIRDKYKDVIMPVDFVGQEASDKIFEMLISDGPVMICRLGSMEVKAMKEMQLILNGKHQYLDQNFIGLKENAGFFPITYNSVKRFYLRMISDIEIIDILGQWNLEEIIFKSKLKNAKKIKLADLEPFTFNPPWTRALEGKKILVVHPFEKTIISQYKKREYLFENKQIMPKFTLKTLKAVQSIGGSNEFEDWFAALKDMEDKIAKIDFDIAILGCGAYGLPLAAFIKRLGKKAVHLGGSSQLLFGIKGKRWEDRGLEIINSYWVKPSDAEKPESFKSVESGCYW